MSKEIDIDQVKCGDKSKKWTDGLHGNIPQWNKIANKAIVTMKGKQAKNMKGILVKAARNWLTIMAKYPEYTLGKFYFIRTQIVTDKNRELAKNVGNRI